MRPKGTKPPELLWELPGFDVPLAVAAAAAAQLETFSVKMGTPLDLYRTGDTPWVRVLAALKLLIMPPDPGDSKMHAACMQSRMAR